MHGTPVLNVDDSLQCDGILYHDAWNPYGSRAVTRLDSFYPHYASSGSYLFISSDDRPKCDSRFIHYRHFSVRRHYQWHCLVTVWMDHERTMDFVWRIAVLALGTLIGLMRKVETAAGISNVLYMLLALGGACGCRLRSCLIWCRTLAGGFHPIISGAERGTCPRRESNLKNILVLIAYLMLFMLLSKYIRRKQEAV